ncbi:hypothetical protein ACLB2K_070075 [Fragaria x ananassa]
MPTNDVVENILSRLPVTSLKRFQSINKSWEALISHPDFVLCQVKNSSSFQILLQILLPCSHAVHTYRRPPTDLHAPSENQASPSIDYKALLKFLKEDDAASAPVVAPRELELEYYTEMAMDPDDAIMEIFGSVNGLICYEFNQTDIVLWNPSTKEFKLLPQATVIEEDHGVASVFYGFGYDNKAKDYKVVRGSYKGEYAGEHFYIYADNGVERSPNNILEVFSLKRDSWSSTEVNCGDLGIDGQGWIDRRDEGAQQSFDLAEEKFSENVQPLCSIMKERIYIGGALNIDNCPAVYASDFEGNFEINTKEYRIWVRRI